MRGGRGGKRDKEGGGGESARVKATKKEGTCVSERREGGGEGV